MIILLSPSKTLDEKPKAVKGATQPALQEESKTLVSVLKAYSAADLQKLMGVSPAIAELNADRFKRFSPPFDRTNAKTAIHMFKGDVYNGLDAATLSAADLAFAQKHVRILSGLYGLLRPLDLIQPYRLEMGTALKTPRGKDLYAFWGERITAEINSALRGVKHPVVINLASAEYFKAVHPKKLDANLITPIFKERKGNQLKVIGLLAKKARGMMTRHLIDARSSDTSDIRQFDAAGYRYDAALSTDHDWVFTR